jgi:methyl-accepting chemotaxis protein
MTKTRTYSCISTVNRKRFFLLFIGFAVLLATALIGCSRDFSAPQDLETPPVREVKEMAAAAATILNVYMDARVTEMLLASKLDGPIRDALTMPEARLAASRAVSEWENISPAYKAILLVDKSGVCVASAPTQPLNRDFSGDKVFREAISGRLALADLHKSDDLVSLDPKSKGWTATIAVPMKVDGGVVGVLMSLLNWSQVKQLVQTIKVGKTGHVFVLNNQSQVIVHVLERLYGLSLLDPDINLPQLHAAIRHGASHNAYDFRFTVTASNKAGTRIGGTDITGTRLVGFAYPKGHGNFPGLGWIVGINADPTELAEPSLWRRFFR